MLQLLLGSEPAALKSVRLEKLPLAFAAYQAAGPGSKELAEALDGYSIARTTLFSRQYCKCAYCETTEEMEFRPVEHFRPKGGADRLNSSGKWVRDVSVYWWLTWTWENLVFACQNCNMVAAKGNRFPLVPGTAPLAPPNKPLPWDEADLTARDCNELLDPRHDDPTDHLQWLTLDRTLPKSMWKWVLIAKSHRGSVTQDILRLRRKEAQVNRHLAHAVRAPWVQIENHLNAGRRDDATREWRRMLDEAVNDPAQPFRAASWWAINDLCPAAEQVTLGLPGLSACPVVTW